MFMYDEMKIPRVKTTSTWTSISKAPIELNCIPLDCIPFIRQRTLVHGCWRAGCARQNEEKQKNLILLLVVYIVVRQCLTKEQRGICVYK